jgi:hypothetical protein
VVGGGKPPGETKTRSGGSTASTKAISGAGSWGERHHWESFREAEVGDYIQTCARKIWKACGCILSAYEFKALLECWNQDRLNETEGYDLFFTTEMVFNKHLDNWHFKLTKTGVTRETIYDRRQAEEARVLAERAKAEAAEAAAAIQQMAKQEKRDNAVRLKLEKERVELIPKVQAALQAWKEKHGGKDTFDFSYQEGWFRSEAYFLQSRLDTINEQLRTGRFAETGLQKP